MASLMTACRPSAQDLANTLPTEINGQPARVVARGDELSGLIAHDAIGALGKTRQDASIADATADPDIVVVAVAVDGISGADLLAALAKTWPTAGPTEPATIGGKSVLRREGQSDTRVYFYARESVVYVVETADDAIAEQLLQALP